MSTPRFAARPRLFCSDLVFPPSAFLRTAPAQYLQSPRPHQARSIVRCRAMPLPLACKRFTLLVFSSTVVPPRQTCLPCTVLQRRASTEPESLKISRLWTSCRKERLLHTLKDCQIHRSIPTSNEKRDKSNISCRCSYSYSHRHNFQYRDRHRLPSVRLPVRRRRTPHHSCALRTRILIPHCMISRA